MIGHPPFIDSRLKRPPHRLDLGLRSSWTTSDSSRTASAIVRVGASFTIARNPSAGNAAANHPITDRSASTTWADSDIATAHTSTVDAKTTGRDARCRRRIPRPEATDINSNVTASAQASHQGCP